MAEEDDPLELPTWWHNHATPEELEWYWVLHNQIVVLQKAKTKLRQRLRNRGYQRKRKGQI